MTIVSLAEDSTTLAIDSGRHREAGQATAVSKARHQIIALKPGDGCRPQQQTMTIDRARTSDATLLSSSQTVTRRAPGAGMDGMSPKADAMYLGAVTEDAQSYRHRGTQTLPGPTEHVQDHTAEYPSKGRATSGVPATHSDGRGSLSLAWAGIQPLAQGRESYAQAAACSTRPSTRARASRSSSRWTSSAPGSDATMSEPRGLRVAPVHDPQVVILCAVAWAHASRIWLQVWSPARAASTPLYSRNPRHPPGFRFCAPIREVTGVRHHDAIIPRCH